MTKHRLVRRLAAASSLALGLCAGVAGAALACGENAYTGQVCIVAGNYCPEGSTEANGQTLAISGNNALYALIGCAYGGDCRTDFQLPDIRGRAAVHEGEGPGLTERFFASSFGEELVTQSIDEMPPHNHGATFVPTPGEGAKLKASLSPGTNDTPATGDYLGMTLSGSIYTSVATPTVQLAGMSGGGTTSGAVAIEHTGAGAAMPNVPPEIAMRFCIVIDGVYPPYPN